MSSFAWGATMPAAKQLAGPPEEFAAMAEADATAGAIHSTSALLAVELELQPDGTLSWSGELPVVDGAARFLVFGGDGSNWQVELASPSSQSRGIAATSLRATERTHFGTENARHEADLYAVRAVEDGIWKITLRAPRGTLQTRGFVLLEGSGHTDLTSYLQHRRQLQGERIGIVALLSGNDRNGVDAIGRAAGQVDAALLRVTAPDGRVSRIPMHDDGVHGDGAARDGVFGGDFLASLAGQYQAQVEVRGSDARARPLVRTAEHVIPVVARSVSVAADRVAATHDATARDRITVLIPVTARVPGQHYRAFAELWGSDARGNRTPVAWIGGMATPAAGDLSLGLDTRWISRAGAQAPFELRNLRIEHPDHFIKVAGTSRLALDLPSNGKLARATFAIDDAMRMGIKPEVLALRSENAILGVGRRLLLVHGYCSGGVWPTSQFATSSSFLDVNQNRTHDDFARRISAFGATWNSFGVVAHSQGGAAALHLYNYYWSGLDNATGARLIQSVGTPYQGTNLAGILAALGSWFGVGCGTNDNLSYSGASAWMAGIPTASRAKVSYYTTAFRSTNWWTNDYCQIATDLVLSDPEDGTTEQSKGQLPGAVNRGHVIGQCHTGGMRDPAQYLDSARNATMSANAAR